MKSLPPPPVKGRDAENLNREDATNAKNLAGSSAPLAPWRFLFLIPIASVGSLVAEIVGNRQLLVHLIAREMRGRYAGSTLGVLWSVFHPLTLMVLYTTLFSSILKIKVATTSSSTLSFGIYLFVGMIPWLAISDALSHSIHLLEENASLLKQNAFSMILLPTHVVIAALVNQCIVTLLTFIFAFYWLNISLPVLAALPILLVGQGLLMIGLSILISTLNPLLKDIGQVVQVFMQVWFFATPIVYPPSMLPPRLAQALNLNPLTHVAAFYRSALLSEPLPSAGQLGFTLVACVLTAVLGGLFFVRVRRIVLDTL